MKTTGVRFDVILALMLEYQTPIFSPFASSMCAPNAFEPGTGNSRHSTTFRNASELGSTSVHEMSSMQYSRFNPNTAYGGSPDTNTSIGIPKKRATFQKPGRPLSCSEPSEIGNRQAEIIIAKAAATSKLTLYCVFSVDVLISPRFVDSSDCLHTPLNAENPPSTATTMPVTNSAPGESSQNKAPRRSSGFPNRCRGVWSMMDRPRGVRSPVSRRKAGSDSGGCERTPVRWR